MKKGITVSGVVFISFLLLSPGLSAQRYYREGAPIEGIDSILLLTQQQIEKIGALDLELEKALDPLFSGLESNWRRLEELEAQTNPDPTEMKKIWDTIYNHEYEIRRAKIQHEKKIRDLLTQDQKALLDSYGAGGMNVYGWGGSSRGYGRFGVDNYGAGGTNAGIGRGGWGRGAARSALGYSGYGRGNWRGYGLNRQAFGLGAGRLGAGTSRYSDYYRSGRGPCGAGWGRGATLNYGRGSWRWNR